MPFQSSVNIFPAVAVAGDFCSANPVRQILSGQGKFVAGAAGVTEALFVWHDPANDNLLNNFGNGAPAGFVHREMRQQITTFLAEFGGLIQPGQEVTAFSGGDFWALNSTGGAITRGQKVYVQPSTGKVTVTGATGLTPAGASFTGVIASGVLTASAVTGTIDPYAPLAGAGIPAGTYLQGQLSGTPGGAGTYTVVGVTTQSSEAMTTAGAVETKWYVSSNQAAGELFKMTSIAEG